MLKMFKSSKSRAAKKREEKSVYSRYIAGHKWYCPAGFCKTDAAIAFFIAIIAFAVLPYVLSPIISIFGGAFSVVELYCFSVLASQAVIFGVAALYSKKRGVPIFSGGGYYCRFDFKSILPAVLLTIATSVLLTPVHTDFVEYLSDVQTLLFGVGSDGDVIIDLFDVDFNDISTLLFLYFIVVPIVPAICEEALFRGVIARGLSELGILGGAFLSGLLFALMHGNYAQLLLQFVLGAEIGYIVLKSGNFAIGMAMHFTNNAFAYVYALMIAFGCSFGSLLPAAFIIAGVGCLVLAIFLFAKYFKSSFFKNEYSVGNSLCCLKRAGMGDRDAFTVNFALIKNKAERLKNGFSDCLYFYNGKFYSFEKNAKSAKRHKCKVLSVINENEDSRFKLFLFTGIFIALLLIFINFLG